MRIVTWNVHHGGGKRASAIVDRLHTLAPDVAVITEFRRNGPGERITAALRDSGLTHTAAPDAAPDQNSVLIASRTEFSPVEFPGLGTESHRALWARFPALDLLGFYFPLGAEKAPVFEAICRLDAGLLERHSILIGDFNTGHHRLDEAGATFTVPEYLDSLEKIGWIDAWRSRNPGRREYSWFSSAGNGFRIDHAFASPSLDSAIRFVGYSHLEREQETSDHSALIVDVDIDSMRARESSNDG